MIKLAVSGCLGKMGQRIIQLALKDNDFTLSAVLEREGHPDCPTTIENLAVSSDLKTLAGNDVLIEFTSPDATVEHLAKCRELGVKMVIGTTGLNDAQATAIQEASEDIPIVFSSNMSIGVNLMFSIAQMLGGKIPDTYDAKITEAHHKHKKDSPSGTAKTLATTFEHASQRKVSNIDAIREGEIVGDHKLILESPEDILTIEHHAKTRDIFVKGALVAAKYLSTKQTGLFTMRDVLGL